MRCAKRQWVGFGPIALAQDRRCNYNVGMANDLRFEWDPGKSTGNLRRHGVSFEDASTVRKADAQERKVYFGRFKE